jgi:hypothetical protein
MDKEALIAAKVDELVDLLRANPLDKEYSNNIRQKINDAIEASSFPKKLEAFRELDKEQNRFELRDDLELLLSQHQLDSKTSSRFLYREKFNRILVGIIGATMIALGMGMIIMPAPALF